MNSASVEAFNWNLLNEVVYEKNRQLFSTIPNDKVFACGCHGRHTIHSILGIFAWSMKIMLGGVHPLTKHDIQHLDAQRSLLTGRPLGLVVVCSKPGVTGIGTIKSLVFQIGVAH